MAGQEALAGQPKKRTRPPGRFKRLSDRTPLRTKLITAVLALVILALVAVSVASTVMLRSYVTTQQDTELKSALAGINEFSRTPREGTVAQLSPGSEIVFGIQTPGKQLTWPSSNGPVDYGGPKYNEQLPQLPTDANWAGADSTRLITAPAQTGSTTWRVLAEPVTIRPSGQSAILVVAVPLGNMDALTTRLALFDLVVGGGIVVVLAVVAVAVVRTNLRPLNDIELTAGQIAAGHLDHRVPEGDPRTEVGSLGRSLNAMLAQIERAFHAQGEAEQAAHQSEERMRRFIADAAHELRTPLTTIRGFAAHYRLRGGASRLRLEAAAPAAASPIGSGSAAVKAADNGSAGTAAADAGAGSDVLEGTIVTGADVAAAGDGGDGLAGSSVPASGSANGGGGGSAEGLSLAELDHLMGRVESEANRMGMLVEDLLTLARLDQQRPINRAPVDLLMVAADAVQDARIVSPGRPIDLLVAPGTAFLVDGDEPRLRQVLANLVNNAITHTPAGTPVRVKIARGSLEPQGSAVRLATVADANGADGTGGVSKTAGEDHWIIETERATAPEPAAPAVVLDVEDDGPGMSAEQAQRVFERFYRADAARNRASGGTGLGLAIVAGLVSAHGGTVSLSTAPGRGADFQVKLPLSPDALGADDSDPDADLPDSDLPA